MLIYPAAAFVHTQAACVAAVSQLSADDALVLDHGALERRARSLGDDFVRALIQDHVDLRTEREGAMVMAVQGADGETRTEVRTSSRPLATIVGTVVVRRIALVRHVVSGGLRPLDARLNLPEGLYSHGVQREIACGVAQSSYDAVVANLRRTTPITIAKRQVEALAAKISSYFEGFYVDQPRRPEDDGDLLVLTFDGAGVVMRPEGLRPETRKRARGSGRNVSVAESAATGRKRDDERTNRKRMAEVAAVYALEPMSRTPEDVMGELARTGPKQVRPKARNKRAWASLERPISDVVGDAFYDASQRDPSFTRRWVAVVDGNQDQIAAIRGWSVRYGIDLTLVIDFIHVLGYLWKAGKVLAKEDEVEAWVSKRALRILQGASSQVAAGIRRSATRRGLAGKPREAVDKCANYLLNHREYLRYDKHLSDGLPIASGVIEGACRSLVKDRMDITGARWGLPGGEAVLKLRSLRASGDLSAYLAFHERKELERNHLRHYAAHELADLREAA